MDKKEEHKWIKQLIQGDEKAFEALYHFYFPKLSQFVFRYVHSTGLAEDMVHNVFFTLWKNRENINPQKSLRPYLYQGVRNQAMKHHEKIKEDMLEDHQLASVMSKEGSMPDEFSEDSGLKEKVIEAVGQLPNRGKQVYLLHREDGLTYKEIAQVLDISVKTVETHMGRSLAFLREYLSD